MVLGRIDVSVGYLCRVLLVLQEGTIVQALIDGGSEDDEGNGI
jgi:hypothetical protein